MNIRDLQGFIHLSQSLHFNHTAAAIHTSPSTLTRMIQRLESEFSQTLFERDNRTVRLTEAGKRFVDFAEAVLSHWQQLKNDFESSTQTLTGELTIYCTVTAAHLYLPPLIEKFRRLHSQVEINLETGDVASAYHKVAQREVDFAFAVAPEKLNKKFAFQHLQTVPFSLIAPKQTTKFSAMLKPGHINWQALPFVLPESGPAAHSVNRWLAKMNIKPEVYAQVSGHEAIVSMIALGCGVGAVPSPVLNNSPVKHKVKILQAPFMPQAFDLGILCLDKRLELPVMRAFWEIVRQSIEQ